MVSRFTVRATHQGQFMGVPATGKVVTYTGITISRMAGSTCVEDWELVDALGLLHQLGVIPQVAQQAGGEWAFAFLCGGQPRTPHASHAPRTRALSR